MTIPFLSLFKRKPVTEHAVVVAPPMPHVEKPSGERLSKTVLPNVVRTSGQDNSTRTNSDGSPSAARVSFSVNGGSGLPPAVALALEPKVERAISLELADVIAQMPPGLTRPLHERDAKRRVLLKAAEIEKGMATARPCVSISTIYEQAPEIFLHPVPASDTTQVPLPFDKVLEQFGKMQLRNDQYRDQNVPQVETPFLQVTLEDNTRFGITMEPIQTGDLPPVRLQPATAASIAAAEPEALMREKVSSAPPRPPGISLHAPAPVAAKKPDIAPPAGPPSAKPARIAFKLTPNGTGAPAAEGVPASSGPSVPTSLPKPAPTRIAFKLAPAKEEPKGKAEPWLTKENSTAEPAATTEETVVTPVLAEVGGKKISLPLKPILQSLPPFQLTGDISGVPDDARLEVPFSLVEAQLLTGRVSLLPDQFAAALSEEYRGLFSVKEIAAPVALSLQEVLKNLPESSLRMREDQQEEEKGSDFATPFSAKAEEDARRFNGVAAATPGPIAKQTAPVEITPPPTVEAEAVKPEPVAAPVPVAAPKIAEPAPLPVVAKPESRSELQTILETDDELDAKTVVSHIERIAGIKACAIMFADGLGLAGNLPSEFEADGLCAMAPSLLQRVENHLVETKLGDLRSLTLCCAEAAITFMMQGNLCLAAAHTADELPAATRERLGRIVHELSQKYSHPV